MTLANGLWTKQAVYLWSDTAWWQDAENNRRTIAMHHAKMVIGEDWPFALVTSGTGPGIGAVAAAVDTARPRDFWQLRETVLGALAGLVGVSGERTLIASFDDKPRLTMIDTEDFLGHPPLTVMELRPFQVCSSGRRPKVARLIEAGVTVETMPEIIRAQHADWRHSEGTLIAGTIGRARVSRDGVELVQVDELPDPMGARD